METTTFSTQTSPSGTRVHSVSGRAPQTARRYVYWNRVGGGTTLTHIEVKTPADRNDRTACGVHYRSGTAMEPAYDEDGVFGPRLCKNCERAVVEWGGQ